MRDFFVEALIAILIYLCGLFSREIRLFVKKRKLNRILGIKKTETDLVVPVRIGKIPEAKSINNDFVSYDEARIFAVVKMN